MKHTILIERWKREACEIEVEAKDADDAEEQALELYFNDSLEDDFEDYGLDADYKDQLLTVYKATTHAKLKESNIN
ncbi:hypothetical protein, partial [Burkholderia cenocepacia]|uniref:hypothetical protein n=1 Tax=Burkholderia cenocepacia TaxID=95486 RepID=UPI0015C5392F